MKAKEKKQFKKWVKHAVEHYPWCYEGSLSDWIKMWSSLMKQSADDGDYEIAQCVKEAIIEMLNERLPKDEQLTNDILFK